jgi:hypothetical protein
MFICLLLQISHHSALILAAGIANGPLEGQKTICIYLQLAPPSTGTLMLANPYPALT